MQLIHLYTTSMKEYKSKTAKAKHEKGESKKKKLMEAKKGRS